MTAAKNDVFTFLFFYWGELTFGEEGIKIWWGEGGGNEQIFCWWRELPASPPVGKALYIYIVCTVTSEPTQSSSRRISSLKD